MIIDNIAHCHRDQPNHHLSSQQHDIQQHSTTPLHTTESTQPGISPNQGSHTADAILGSSNDVIASRHQQYRHLSSQHNPSPHHITTTLPTTNPTTQSIELGSSVYVSCLHLNHLTALYSLPSPPSPPILPHPLLVHPSFIAHITSVCRFTPSCSSQAHRPSWQ